MWNKCPLSYGRYVDDCLGFSRVLCELCLGGTIERVIYSGIKFEIDRETDEKGGIRWLDNLLNIEEDGSIKIQKKI